MPVTPTYPGVYIEEVPSGVRTITGVATSITAFIGSAPRGPDNEPISINSYGDYERIFGGLALKSTMSFAVRDFFLNGGGQAIIVRLHNGAEASTITLNAEISSPVSPPLILEAASVGAWGKNLSGHVDYDTKDKDKPDAKLFNLTIYEKDPTIEQTLNTEKFINVSVDSSDSRYLPRVLEESSNMVRVKKDSDSYKVSDVRPAQTVTIASPPTSPPDFIDAPVKALDGKDGGHLEDKQFFGTGMEDDKEGLYALEKADLFNLLCIPSYTSSEGTTPALDEQPTDVTTELLAHAEAYCKKRRTMLLVDAHSQWKNKDKAKASFTATSDAYPGTNSSYAAIFFPRLKQRNLLRDNQMEEFVPCGAVAGYLCPHGCPAGSMESPGRTGGPNERRAAAQRPSD